MSCRYYPGMPCQKCEQPIPTQEDRYFGGHRWNLCQKCGAEKKSEKNAAYKAKKAKKCAVCQSPIRKSKRSGVCRTCESTKICPVCVKPFVPKDPRSIMHQECSLVASKREHGSKFSGVFKEKPGPRPRVEPLPKEVLDTPAERNRVAELLEKARRERVTLELSRWS